MSLERDRNAQGRARNDRARDRLGRPLPRGVDGVVPLDEDEVLAPAQSLAAAQRLLDTGFPFQAHEVLEASWKAAPEAERPLWQGLAQLAVGVTHAERGNLPGAVALIERGAAAIDSGEDVAPYGIDVAGLVQWARSSVRRLTSAQDEPVSIDAPRLCRSSEDLDVLVRWERCGGVWRVVDHQGPRITISLLRCDGGEEQLRLVSTDPALTEWLGGRTASDLDGP